METRTSHPTTSFPSPPEARAEDTSSPAALQIVRSMTHPRLVAPSNANATDSSNTTQHNWLILQLLQQQQQQQQQQQMTTAAAPTHAFGGNAATAKTSKRTRSNPKSHTPNEDVDTDDNSRTRISIPRTEPDLLRTLRRPRSTRKALPLQVFCPEEQLAIFPSCARMQMAPLQFA